MTDINSQIQKYFNQLTLDDRASLEARLDQYRDQIENQGYEATIAESENGFFAGVLVIDDEKGRFGFLEDNGSITWISGSMGGIGALGSAVAQNPSEALEQDTPGLENVDID